MNRYEITGKCTIITPSGLTETVNLDKEVVTVAAAHLAARAAVMQAANRAGIGVDSITWFRPADVRQLEGDQPALIGAGDGPAAIVPFAYGELDPETRIVVQQKASEIKTLMRRMAQDLMEIGQKLIEVKQRLGHGRFGDWLESEFGWAERTAQNFMRVADTFKTANFADLSIAPSALYLLASHSTPDTARQEAVTRAQKGEVISHAVAKEIVQESRPATMPRIMVVESEAPAAPEVREWVRMDIITDWVEEWAKAVDATAQDLENMRELPFHVGWPNLNQFLDRQAGLLGNRVRPDDVRQALLVVQERRLATAKASPLTDMEQELISACYHAMGGAKERWQERRQAGMTDDELRQALNYEWGMGGGSSGPGSPGHWRKGGVQPAFWYPNEAHPGKPTLTGRALLERVRQLLEIPYTGETPATNKVSTPPTPRAVTLPDSAYNAVAASLHIHPKTGAEIAQGFLHTFRPFVAVALSHQPDGRDVFNAYELIEAHLYEGATGPLYQGLPVVYVGKEYRLGNPHDFTVTPPTEPPHPLDVLAEKIAAHDADSRERLIIFMEGVAIPHANHNSPAAVAFIEAIVGVLEAEEES